MATSQGLSPEKARQRFAVELLKLEMNNEDFVARLNAQGFFSGNQKADMLSKTTEKARASFFLDYIIDRDVDVEFVRLLDVMENFGGPMQRLATKIKAEMGQTPGQNTGQYYQPPAQVPGQIPYQANVPAPGQVPYQANVPAPGQYYQPQAPGQYYQPLGPVPGQYYQPLPGQYYQAPAQAPGQNFVAPSGYPPNYQYTSYPGGPGGPNQPVASQFPPSGQGSQAINEASTQQQTTDQMASNSDSIDCSFAKADLEHQYDAFCRLPINSMLSTLFTKGVVTLQQKQNIERTQKNNGDGMTVFVDLVLESLQQKVPDKYVGFRETLKSSDDKLLQQMAAKLNAKPKSTSPTKPPPNESTKSKPTSSSVKPHGTAALAGATSNQNDDDDEGTEKIINPDNGSGVVSDTTMTEIKGAVCLIRGSQGTGTGFIGRMKLNGKFTFVLMTNNHVFGDEDTAQGSCIEFQFLPHQPIYLSELIEEGQFFWTNPKKELDFSIVKINGEKLEEKLRKNDKSIIPINLCASASIKTGDYIRIIQHPHGGELSMSMSTCKVLDALLLYESGTHPGSSGSPVLKEIDGMLAIVALHRGGREVDPNKDIKIGYNYATLFSEIQKCVSGKDYKKKPKVKKIQEFLDECESK